VDGRISNRSRDQVLEHYLAIIATVYDRLYDALSNQILITAAFVFDVVFDGVAVEAFRQGDEHLKHGGRADQQPLPRPGAGALSGDYRHRL
jgi:NADPH:quinone reductase-like Zn-dependent oxidoreductase